MEEFERLKEAIRQAPTPEARRQAAQRFKEYQQAKKTQGRPPPEEVKELKVKSLGLS